MNCGLHQVSYFPHFSRRFFKMRLVGYRYAPIHASSDQVGSPLICLKWGKTPGWSSPTCLEARLFVLWYMAYWAPPLASKLGIKSITYSPVCAAALAYNLQQIRKDRQIAAGPPPGYPSSAVVLRPHEARLLHFLSFPVGEGLTFHERFTAAMKRCDVVSIWKDSWENQCS